MLCREKAIIMTTKAQLNTTTSITNAHIADLNSRYTMALNDGLQSERDKLLVYVAGYRLVETLGGPNAVGIQPFYDARGILKTSGKRHNLAAQLVTGRNVTTTTNGASKKQARNIVDRAADLMGALEHFTALAVIASLTDAQVVDWIEQNGGLNGVVKKHKDALKADGQPDDPYDVIDLQAHRAALENAGIRLAITEPLIAPEPGLSLHQRDGSNLLVLPLQGIPADIMERLREFLPAPDANASPSVRLWGGVTLTCQLFDRIDSRLPLRADQERHEGEAKAPSRPIVRLLSGSSLSIAASRVDVGMVVTVEITDKNLHLSSIGTFPAHLNATATNLLSDRLAGAARRGSFERASVTVDDGKTWIKFVGKEGVKDFRVRVLPMEHFGSSLPQWTLGVASSFKPVAHTRLELSESKLPADLLKFADKAGTSRHNTGVAIRTGKLNLTLGKSSEQEFGGEGSGDVELTVSSADFARTIGFAQQLGLASCTVSLDPKGLAAFTFATEQARFTAHIPALNSEGARMTALLKLIEKAAA